MWYLHKQNIYLSTIRAIQVKENECGISQVVNDNREIY